MGLRRENYYPLGICVWVCIALCCATFVYGQGQQESCIILVKQELPVVDMHRQVNTVRQSKLPYYIDWENSSDVISSDDQYAELPLAPLKTGEMIHFTNFGFQIPDDSQIEGIIVRVKGKAEGDGYIRERAVKLKNGFGEITGTNQAGKGYDHEEWSEEDGTWAYGLESETWGTYWNTEDINSSEFGVAIQLRNGSGSKEVTAMIDYVTVEVYYTEVFRFCDGDCVSFSATHIPNIKEYNWRWHGQFELVSQYEKADIINLGQGTAEYGRYEICVDVTDYSDNTFTCCRPYIFESCIRPDLGNKVWVDLNANGLQDEGEQGYPGLEIRLYTAEGAFIDATVSDSLGNYLFEELAQDDYYIEVDLPEAYLFSPINLTIDSLNSDIDESNGSGTSRIFTLGDDDNLDIDIGLAEELIIGDFVWEDCNANGLQDEDEKGIQEVEVHLFQNDIQLATTSTDSSGYYEFNKLYVGTYSMEFLTIQEWIPTIQVGGNPQLDSDIDEMASIGNITFLEGGVQDTVDAGFFRYGSIGDFVWLDQNRNGIQDAGEEGLEGTEVRLLNGSEVIETIIVDQTGSYSFDSIIPGNYIVEIIPPFGYESTLYQVSMDSLKDSDIVTSEPPYITDDIIIKSGVNDLSIDLGLRPRPGSIDGIVWMDENVNGTFEEGEIQVAGSNVKLLSNGEVIRTVTADQNGRYVIDSIYEGTYQVQFYQDSTLLFTYRNIGVDDLIDSDVKDNGLTRNIVITPGFEVKGINAGYVIPAFIGDYVWFDENRNGLQDDSESGIQGAILTLNDANGDLLQTVNSGIAGAYSFGPLFPAPYILSIDLNSDLIPTNSNDSDFDRNSDITDVSGLLVLLNDSLGYDEVRYNIDAGFMLPGGDVNGVVWNDVVLDGIRNNDEPRLNDVNVQIITDEGVIIEETITDESGYYEFIAVEPGQYKIVVEGHEDFTTTSKDDGDESLDSDFNDDGTRIISDAIEIIEGVILNNIDAGLVAISNISGLVWNDASKDGLRDNEEQLLSNIEVQLFNIVSQEFVSTLLSDPDGSYSFNRIIPGNYQVIITLPDSYRITGADQGDDLIDSDFMNHSGNVTSPTIVLPGDIENLDAGIIEQGSISGLIWKDVNGNGIREGQEPKIIGIGVTLFDTDNTVVGYQTSSLDGYKFNEIDQGQYYVMFEVEGGLIATSADVGGDDTIDSDVTEANGPFTTSTFTLDINGQENIDIGLLELGNISGKVWKDENGNGLRDSGEPGRNGVEVVLYDGDGIEVGRYTTDILNGMAGSHLFEDVLAGSYYIQFEVEGGLIATSSDVGGDDTIDSDVTEANGPFTTSTFTLDINGQENLDIGLLELGNISGRVWKDENGNGLRDSGEPGRNGVEVVLYDGDGVEVDRSTTAILNGMAGSYLFEDVLAGSYYIQFEVEGGMIATSADVGGDDTIDSDVTGENGLYTTSTFNLTNTGIPFLDLGLLELGGINGIVWKDVNGNGILEGGEPTIPEIEIILFNAIGVEVSRTSTNSSGMYNLEDVLAGTYYIQFLVDEIFEVTLPNIGMDESMDSDVTEENGSWTTSDFEVPGQSNFINAGVIELGDINGIVWNDTNNNGLREPDEPKYSEVIVNLFDSNMEIIGMTSTDENGTYLFEDILAGDYYLTFDLDQNISSTIPNTGSDDSIDSDVTGTFEPFSTDLFSLDFNGFDNVDFGFQFRGNISGEVWLDTDEDGIREAGEPGRNGIAVRLFNSSGEEVVMTTTAILNGAAGSYEFVDILAGEYYVGFEVMEGFLVSPADVGGDDTVDSDVTGANGSLTTSSFTLTETGISNLDLGIYEEPELGNIAGRVWLDSDEDGIREGGEPGRNGIVVRLFNTSGDEVSMTTTAILNGAAGSYEFVDVLAGSYYVGFEVMEGFLASPADVGGDDAVDSDVTGANGAFTTSSFTLTETGISNLDLGIYE
ncbi:MAG: hypothetical protein HKN68_10545, partial [Saprospiraceae bacterium]|nr:hypothetical protein [Saprospiraceae bacterium]